MKLIIFLLTFLFLMGLVSGNDFELSSPEIKISLKQGDSFDSKISLLNLDKNNDFIIYFESKFDFVSLDKQVVSLEAYEAVDLNLKVKSDGLEPGIYVGSLRIESAFSSAYIPVILELETDKPLFDIALSIPSRFYDIDSKKLSFDVRVYNLRSGNPEVDLVYKLFDFSGEEVYSSSERVNVNNQLELRKTVSLNELLEEEYILGVYSLQGSSYGLSSEVIKIDPNLLLSPQERPTNFPLYLLGLVVICLIVAFFIFNHYWNKRVLDTAKHWDEKVKSIQHVKFGAVGRNIRKLKEQEYLLEQAYSKGYIKKASYVAGKSKINSLINNLKKRL